MFSRDEPDASVSCCSYYLGIRWNSTRIVSASGFKTFDGKFTADISIWNAVVRVREGEAMRHKCEGEGYWASAPV
jgi:hypothetical protein